MKFVVKLMGLLRYPFSVVFLLTVPFIVLVRGAVYFYQLGWDGYWALLLASVLTILVLLGYFVAVDRWFLTRIYVPLQVKLSIVAVFIIAFNAYGLFVFSDKKLKEQTMAREYTQVHPLLRMAVSTVSYVDGAMILTDMSRTRKDYEAMGLSTLERSLHYVQSDGYVHAVDLRTNGRLAVSNWLIERVFRVLGFNTLRHIGTADHLHISLPIN